MATIGTLVSDSWRLTNLIISPQYIVGGGKKIDGSDYQKFSVTPVINVGLATTVYLSSASNLVDLSNLNFSNSLDLNQGASVTGLYSAFSTSLITGVTFIATGPTNSTISTSNFYVYPFLIDSVQPTSLTTFYAGLNTNTNIAFMNAYPLAGIGQTVKFTTHDKIITFDDYTKVKNGIQTFLDASYLNLNFNYGADKIPTNTSFSTTVTLSLLSSSGYSTNVSLTFQGLSSNYALKYSNLYLDTGKLKFSGSLTQDITYPTSISYANSVFDYPAGINTGNPINFIVASGYTSSSTFDFSSSISTNIKKVIKTSVLGYNSSGVQIGVVTQNFFTNAFLPGYAKGVGFNFYGELGNGIPTIGLGTFTETSLGTLSEKLVKVSSGLYHNLGLTTSGKVYALGQNTYSQLNVNISGLSTSVWKLCQAVTGYGNSDYRDIFAGQYSSFFVTKDNNVYGIGLNNYNQLGFASNNNSYCGVASYVINNFYDVDVNSIYRGCFITADENSNFSLYEFGVKETLDGSTSNGIYNQVTQKTINQLTFNNITSSVSMNYITKVSLGLNHAIASASWKYTDISSPLYNISSSGIIAWGYNNYMQIGSSPASSSYFSTPNILTKFSNTGTIIPIEYSENLYANNYSSVIIGTGNSNYYIGVGSSVITPKGYLSPSLTTSIATPVQMIDANTSQAITDQIFKVAKSDSHLIAMTGLGSVYVSGSNTEVYKQVLSTPVSLRDFIFVRDCPTSFTTTQNSVFYSSPSVVNIKYGTGFGTYFNSTNSQLIKSRSYVNYNKDTKGDIIATQFSDKVIAFLYQNAVGVSTVNYDFNNYFPTNFNIVDIGVGNSYVNYGDTFSTIPLIIAGYVSNTSTYNNYILSYPITIDGNYNVQNIGFQSYCSTNETYITSIACGMNLVKQEKINNSGTVYDWVSSNYNVCAGFNDGLISVYSDVNGGFGTYVTFNDPTLRLAYQGYGSSLSSIDTIQVLPYKQEKSSPYNPPYCLLVSQKDSSVSVYGFSTTSLGQFDFYYYTNQLVNGSAASNYGTVKYFTVSEAFSNIYDYYILGLTDEGYGMQIYSYTSTPNTFYYSNEFSFSGKPTSCFFSFDANSDTNYSYYQTYFTTDQKTITGWYWPFKQFEVGLNYYSDLNHKLVTIDGSQTGSGLMNVVDVSSNLYQSVFLTKNS